MWPRSFPLFIALYALFNTLNILPLKRLPKNQKFAKLWNAWKIHVKQIKSIFYNEKLTFIGSHIQLISTHSQKQKII